MKRSQNTNKNKLRQVRHTRVRATLKGTGTRPRISVFRGNRAMTVQLIDDAAHKTLCFVNTREVKSAKAEGKTTKVAAAIAAGKLLAEKAAAAGIKTAVFDRGGYKFHGRVAAVAEGARAGGLQF